MWNLALGPRRPVDVIAVCIVLVVLATLVALLEMVVVGTITLDVVVVLSAACVSVVVSTRRSPVEMRYS